MSQYNGFNSVWSHRWAPPGGSRRKSPGLCCSAAGPPRTGSPCRRRERTRTPATPDEEKSNKQGGDGLKLLTSTIRLKEVDFIYLTGSDLVGSGPGPGPGQGSVEDAARSRHVGQTAKTITVRCIVGFIFQIKKCKYLMFISIKSFFFFYWNTAVFFQTSLITIFVTFM